MKSVAFVLFGATGDLAQRKVMPALCALWNKGAFPADSQIIVSSRRPWGSEEYREFAGPSLGKFSATEKESFLQNVEYVQVVLDDVASYARLKEAIRNTHVSYHLAVQPEFYPMIADHLVAHDIHDRLLIEKPLGRDLASAQALEGRLERDFPPERILRIDHYLGKPGLDAFLARREDPHVEAKLSRHDVAAVACRVRESLSIEGRGEFYDTQGALRDVGQNHVLQMLAAVLAPDWQPRERAQALAGLLPLSQGAVRAQYEGYEEGEGVRAGSQTETYFKINAVSSDPRWEGVPIVLEAGKALAAKQSEIEINFTDGSREVFDMDIPGPDAYEEVLQAALAGDPRRFVGKDEVEASWRFADAARAILAATPLRRYAPGSDAEMLK